MRGIHRQLGSATVALALAGLAACSRPASTDDSLQKDLQQASSSLTMLPNGSGTAVVSAIEQTPSATPAVAKRQNTPKRTPQRVSAKPALAEAVTVTPEVVHEEMPAPAQPAREELPAAPAPRAPQGRATQAPPPGGFKTIDEIMRKAPFPINP
jgi:hypothetical protein